MRQVLFNINVWGANMEIASYTFFLSSAAIFLFVSSLFISARKGLPTRKVAIILLAGLIFAAIGARLMHRITSPGLYIDDPGLLYSFRRAGLALYGGFFAAIPAVVILCRLFSIDAWRLSDYLAPGLAIAAVLVRIGCFLNGCCYGKPTKLPWGVSYPFGSSAHADQLENGAVSIFEPPLPVHPTQIYEAVAAIIGLILIILVLKRRLADGVALLAFFLWFTAFRWFNYYLLETSRLSVQPWFYPALYAITIAIVIMLLIKRLRSNNQAILKHPNAHDC